MVKVRGVEVERGPVNFRTPSVSIKLRWVVLAWLVVRLARLTVWFLRRPLLTGSIALGLWLRHVWVTVSPWPVVAAAVVLVGLLAGWRWRWPVSFAQRVVWRMRGWWRRLTVYRTGWQPAMATIKLAERIGDATYLPELVRVRSTGTVDLVTVRMLPGQILADWSQVGERLAATFGGVDCR